MDRKTHTISIDFGNGENKRYSPEFQEGSEYASSFKSVLKRAHALGDVRCKCHGRGDKFLAVRYMEESDHFFLARYPETGHQHAMDCKYYSENPSKSGLSGYQKGVVEETRDGKYKIKLAVGLETKGAKDKQDENEVAAKSGSSGRYQSAMSLLGLLHWLWSHAGLNCWYPAMEGKRNLDSINYWIRKEAEHIAAGKVKLSDVLLLSSSGSKNKVEKNKVAANQAKQKKHRMIVIAPLAKHSEDKEAGTGILSITGFEGIPVLKVSGQLWQTKLSNFANELKGWKAGSKIIVIAQAEYVHTGAEVIDLALMRVTDRWIPVQSDYEAAAEAAMYQGCRKFEKPLRYDVAEKTFPDFWLLDMGQDFPCEVFGMTTESYLARMAEKMKYYNDNYGCGGWWYWDANSAEEMPELPVQARSPD